MWILKEARLFGMQIRYVKIQIKYLRKILIKMDNDNVSASEYSVLKYSYH